MRALYFIVPAFLPGFALAAAPRDEVVVAATRLAAPASATGVTTIDSAALEHGQFGSVADALRFVDGVSIASAGGAGAVATARLRGSTSAQTLVVIDGAIVNDPAAPQGAYDFSDLLTDDIARIEILRGPQSLLWGADAIGGVIAVETKSTKAGSLALNAEGGSYGATRGAVTVAAGEEGGAHLRATAIGVRTSGFSRAASGTEADGWRAGSLSLRAGTDFGDGLRGEVSARYGQSKTDIDGFPPPAFALADTADTERREDFLVSGRLRHESQRVDGVATLAFGGLNRRGFDGSGAEAYASDGKRLSASYVARARFGDAFGVSAGLDAQRTTNRSAGVDASARRAGAFLIAEVDFSPSFAPGSKATLSVGGRRDAFSNFDGATTARVAGAWSFADGTTLRAGCGTGFRAPSLFELNYADFGVVPNPDLRPERARGWEVGIEKPFGGGAFVARATAFGQAARDLIDFSFAANGYVNIARTRTRGVEASTDWRLSPALSLAFSYTFIDSKDLTTGLRLARTPRHRGSATATFAVAPRLTIAAALYANGSERDVPTDNRAFARLDLRASYKASEAVDIYGRIENATGARYQDVSGYRETGAAAYVGTRLRL